jgi:hypothetical protein
MFFSEEKNQKTFASGARGWIQDMAGDRGGGATASRATPCDFVSKADFRTQHSC